MIFSFTSRQLVDAILCWKSAVWIIGVQSVQIHRSKDWCKRTNTILMYLIHSFFFFFFFNSCHTVRRRAIWLLRLVVSIISHYNPSNYLVYWWFFSLLLDIELQVTMVECLFRLTSIKERATLAQRWYRTRPALLKAFTGLRDSEFEVVRLSDSWFIRRSRSQWFNFVTGL